MTTVSILNPMSFPLFLLLRCQVKGRAVKLQLAPGPLVANRLWAWRVSTANFGEHALQVLTIKPYIVVFIVCCAAGSLAPSSSKDVVASWSPSLWTVL